MSTRKRCEIRTASDGTKVRVNGDISQGDLDALAARVRAIHDAMCHHEGPILMPAVGQRAHGREHYDCGLDKGHDGQHEWYGMRWDS